ncbi:MAG: alpha/beta hydrolase [Pseudomonadales bacterium]|nr:alpha/beta hydrolase [Pseudomonadales bacterium]
MKTKKILANASQDLGLKLINTLSRSNRYQLQSDIAFGTEPRQKLDYYRVKGDSCRPTVLFFYGGNWSSGEKRNYRFVADALVQHGYNVIIPDYRLYPSVRFDEIQQDSIAATQWVLSNVPEEQPIFMMGHSAGAQMAALLCLNTALLKGELGDRIKGFVGLAGPYDFFPFTEDHHWDLFSPEALYPDSQAINYVRHDGPPMYLLHGEDDDRVRRGHSKSLMEKVQAEGGVATREVYAKMGHVGIILEFSPIHRRSSLVIKDTVAFLNQCVSNHVLVV